MFLPLQALHKISLRDSVCTARVSSSLLSLISLLVDLGVLADANRRRRASEAAAVAAAKERKRGFSFRTMGYHFAVGNKQ